MLLTLITFIFILSVLVLVHEGGHFLVAKKSGIKVEEFGFGYPPKIIGKKIGRTIYSLNAIPFGGFVRLYGEEKVTAGKDAFYSKSKKVRAGVILAGVLANFILAIVCFSVVYSATGIPVKTNRVKIVGLTANSPAESAGLKENDLLLKINQNPVLSLKQFTEFVGQFKGKQVAIEVERKENNPCRTKVFGGGQVNFSCVEGNLLFFLTPRENPPAEEGPLGVIVTDVEIKKYPLYQMPIRGAFEGFKEAFGWGGLILNSLGMMFANLVFKGIIPRDMAGPIGIFQVTGQVAKSGLLNILQFMGVLSVNLAVLNVMPIPAMDGGRLVFIVYETVTGKKPRPSIEQAINTIGMFLIILLIILITINDLARIF